MCCVVVGGRELGTADESPTSLPNGLRKRAHAELRAKIWLLLLSLILLVALATGAYLYVQAKRAEPAYSGELKVPGLRAAVTITFGPFAIPSIEAASREDLFMAQGFMVASERMWQMDLMRRLAKGELAQVLGAKLVAADRLFRTLGLGQAARRSLEALDADTRNVLEAYSRGVNVYRHLYADRLPLEYRLADFEPAPWSPLDSLAISEYMSFVLSFNVREELVYLRLASLLGTRKALELFPSDEGIPAPPSPLELPAREPLSRASAKRAHRPGLLSLGLPLPGSASNAWAVSGKRTRDGLALLANDPHLSPSTPAIWYELEMKSPDYHAAGISLPGVPLIIIGHNEELAWGLTTTMADTQDIFLERPTEGGNAVERADAGPERIVHHVEEISIRGQPEPLRLAVRSTSNGVLINEILGANAGTPFELFDPGLPYLLALKSNLALPDRALQGIYQLNTASSVDAGRAAVRLLSHASQSILFASRHGLIGWQVTGALPLRRGGLGTFPMPAWTGEFGWDAYLPREQNPGGVSESGVLVTANNRLTAPHRPVHLSRSWLPPFRARRIREMLSDHQHLTDGHLRRMQLDRTNLEARYAIKALRQLAPELRQADAASWQMVEDYLLSWDQRMLPDSASAALFLLLRAALFTEIFSDELGEDLPVLESTTTYTYHALLEVIRTGRSSFWDDVRTPETEKPADIWGRALRKARAALERRQGSLHTARQDKLTRLLFPHALHGVPLVGGLFSVGPLGTGGGDHTVNVMKGRLLSPENPLFVPTYRVVFTPGNWSETRGTQTLGQSGHRFSPHRTDQLDDWLSGRTHAWHWNGPPPDQTMGVLRLVPGSPVGP